MLLHPWIDFTTFAFSDAAVDADSPFVTLAGAQWIAFVLRGPPGLCKQRISA